MWESFCEKLEIPSISSSGREFLPKPNIETIELFEKKYGIKLPFSYREFTLQLGTGELGDFFRIAAPLSIPCIYDLEIFNRTLHGDPAERLLNHFGPQELTDRFEWH